MISFIWGTQRPASIGITFEFRRSRQLSRISREIALCFLVGRWHFTASFSWEMYA